MAILVYLSIASAILCETQNDLFGEQKHTLTVYLLVAGEISAYSQHLTQSPFHSQLYRLPIPVVPGNLSGTSSDNKIVLWGI